MGLCSRCADKNCIGFYSKLTECEDFKPETNADKVRAMSDEELAKFLCATVNCGTCRAQEFCRTGHNGWLDWLKQEAE